MCVYANMYQITLLYTKARLAYVGYLCDSFSDTGSPTKNLLIFLKIKKHVIKCQCFIERKSCVHIGIQKDTSKSLKNSECVAKSYLVILLVFKVPEM